MTVAPTSYDREPLGRRSECRAGGDSIPNTAPEGTVLGAASGRVGAGLRSAGDTAGEGLA
jgi:hypothetical protein